MKKLMSSFLAFFSIFAWSEKTPQELLLHIDQLRGYADSGFSFDIINISYKPGKKPKKNKLKVKVLDDFSLVKFSSPAREKGRAMLKQHQDM